MKIALGSDHAGYKLKDELKNYLTKKGYEVKDFGPHSDDSVDYPDYAELVGCSIIDQDYERGILFCGSGVGISIAANKIDGIRAVMCRDSFTAQLSRQHNDTNVLVFGSWFTPVQHAAEITEVWLSTKYDEGERHKKRLEKIKNLETKG